MGRCYPEVGRQTSLAAAVPAGGGACFGVQSGETSPGRGDRAKDRVAGEQFVAAGCEHGDEHPDRAARLDEVW
jgi:hypothetical protein